MSNSSLAQLNTCVKKNTLLSFAAELKKISNDPPPCFRIEISAGSDIIVIACRQCGSSQTFDSTISVPPTCRG